MESRILSKTFQKFYHSEKSSGLVLIGCTVLSLLIANSSFGSVYADSWKLRLGGLSVEHWINDALMAIFFLLVGLELERELYNGELSKLRNALLPIFAALGGIATPALIHFSLNAGTPTQAGIGIPMATDIAFSLGVLALLGNRVPASLKVFVVAFAVIDDLCAVVIIALFYSMKISLGYLFGALAVWVLLGALNRFFRVMSVTPYLLGGVVLWFLMLKSGIHPTIAGVMLAFAIPFSGKTDDETSPSHRLEHFLQKPVAFIILPIFALANTAIHLGVDWRQNLSSLNSIGIAAGLIVGKPLGVSLFCLVAVLSGLCRLPADLSWRHVIGAGILGGIGFTMSIFIANLAFPGDVQNIDASKMAILVASLTSGFIGWLWLRGIKKPCATEAAQGEELPI